MNINFLEILSVDSIVLCFTLILFLPTTVLFLECVAAFLPAKKSVKHKAARSDRRPTVTVLIAAHNEEAVIGGTIAAILPQLRNCDKLVVIADNCSDRTASVAKNFNAFVIERRNLEQKGKGYALDYGLRSIQQDPRDVVIIIDADCHVEPNKKLSR